MKNMLTVFHIGNERNVILAQLWEYQTLCTEFVPAYFAAKAPVVQAERVTYVRA